MNVLLPTPTDAASLASAVRQIALQAHRVLAEPAPSAFEIQELSQSLANLRRQLRGRSTGSVMRWLDSFDQKLSNALLEPAHV